MATPTLKKKERLKTPALCFKALPPPDKILPNSFPPDIRGYCRWLDLDPANPADVSTTVHLFAIDANGNYSGRSAEPENFILCNLNWNPIWDTWLLEMVLHGLRVPPEDFQFAPFQMDLAQPLDTGLQTLITISGRDERQCQVAF